MKNILFVFFMLQFIYSISIYSQEGTLDQNFANNGTFEINSPSGFSGMCEELVVDSNNNIYSIGTSYMNVNQDYEQIIVKLLPNGTPDVTFGNNGIVTSPSTFGTLKDIAIQNTGKIIITSYVNGTIYIRRLDQDGSFDLSFAQNGVFMFSTNYWGSSSSLLLHNNDIFIGGIISSNPVIFKLYQNGILDSTFGTNGYFYLPSGGFVIDIQVDNQGMLYCAYFEDAGWDRLVLLTKLNTQGIIDTNFGINGVLELYTVFVIDVGEIKIINNSLYLLINHINEVSAFGSRFAKANLNGTIDNSFGNNGFYSNSYRILSFLVQNDYKILTGGYEQFDDNKKMFRLNASGQLDSSFGDNGVIENMPIYMSDFKFQGSDSFLIGGNIFNGDNHSYAISRYLITNPALSTDEDSSSTFTIFPNPIQTD